MVVVCLHFPGAAKNSLDFLYDAYISHLVIIDGHHLMYRAYWAIPRTLRTSKGEQNNTVFGVASMLLAIFTAEEPDALVVCFDEGEETFRHKEVGDYAKMGEYKEGRAETPDDFYDQIPRVLELIDAFSLRHVSDLKYEADDFLCTYARAGEKAGMKVTIVTGDRDAFQLAGEKIRIAIPHKGYQQAEYLDAQGVEKKLGVRPDQVASYKGLCGDSSDHLSGVRGIGPKTAVTLLEKYGSLQGIYEHLGDIRPIVREKLERDREQAFFCERMAALVCDVPLPCSLTEIAIRAIPVETVTTFFREMEFSLLTRRFAKLTETPYGKEHFSGEVAVESSTKALKEPALKEKESQQTLF